jgi:hypothetical protein
MQDEFCTCTENTGKAWTGKFKTKIEYILGQLSGAQMG